MLDALVRDLNFLKSITSSTVDVEALDLPPLRGIIAIAFHYHFQTTNATVVEGVSFGQSTGLKDDLDVDDDVGEKKRQAFLDLLMEAGQNGVVLNEQEVKEQVDTIMFEV